MLLRFSFDIQTFLAICSLLVIQNLSKLHEEMFGKKCQSTSDELQSALYKFTVAGTSHIMCTSVFIVCTL